MNEKVIKKMKMLIALWQIKRLEKLIELQKKDE